MFGVYRKELVDALAGGIGGGGGGSLLEMDVRSYAAVGDGTTDDTAAITAAVATGKALYFPQPSVYYKVVGTVNISVPFDAGSYQVHWCRALYHKHRFGTIL